MKAKTSICSTDKHLQAITNEKMGWRPDIPDHRDHLFVEKVAAFQKAEPVDPNNLPAAVTISRAKLPPVFDQGYTGSCVGNCISTMMSYTRGVSPRSRLQIYYEARRLIGETEVDQGAYIRDGLKVISTLGAGRESWWPYDETKVFVDPPLSVDRDALKRRIFNYSRLVTPHDFQYCLAQKFPFVIGFAVYDGFLNRQTAMFGITTLPKSGERMRGGHAITVIGYDNNFRTSDWAVQATLKGYPAADVPERVYICRNSWSEKWGNKGDFAIDARYLENNMLADDAWTIRKTK